MSDAPAAALHGAPVHIETNGYLLRSLVPADATPRFLEWLNSEKMMTGLNLPPLNFSMEQLRHFIAGFDNQQNYLIGIFDTSNHLLVGFYTIDVNPTHKVGNITTGIGEREYLGRGVLWATIDALLDHFYAYRDVEKMTARLLARNFPMLFNFKDNPRFVLEAQLRKECRAPDGARLDILVYASFKEH